MKKMSSLIILMLVPLLSFAPESGQYPLMVEPIRIGDSVLNAIIDYESKGNPYAVNLLEDAVGILQITPIAIKEVNRILSINGTNKSYTLNDRWDPNKSKEIYYITQNFHNPNYNAKLAARLWNGGTIEYRSATERYWEEIRKRL